MAEFASKGIAGTGLGLGIAGTALGLLSGAGSGLLNMVGNCARNNGCYGNYNCGSCSEDHLVNRYEMGLEQKIAEKDTQIALRDANIYNDQKMIELYKYIDGELRGIRESQADKWANQGVINAQLESGVNVLGSQVASINNTLSNLTKTVIPNANVCPGWGNACVSPAGCSTDYGMNCNVY